jgi:phosphonatase-like hydrolase
MEQIKMVVFDMAGTTVNEDNIVYKTLQKAINESGFDFTLQQVLDEGAGKEKLQAIKSILTTYADNTDEHLAAGIFKNFMEQLTIAYNTLPVYPQPNAGELFAELQKRGIKVVLNTGYSRTIAQTIIEKLGWYAGADFDGLVTADDVIKNRPNPDMILFAMKSFGITNPAQVIKVGDSIIDIQEGQNAGCGFSIGITTGAHTPTQLKSANPDLVIDNLMEIVPVIEQRLVV